MKVPMPRARKTLAYLWFGLAGLIFFYLFALTLSGRFPKDELTQLWGFLLPSVVPALSLMVAVFFMDPAVDEAKRPVEGFLLGLAVGISAVYLLVLGTTLWWLANSQQPIHEATSVPNIFLGPFQGTVSAALAYFFVKPKPVQH